MDHNPDIDMAPILKFVEHPCLHLDSHFPENELADWNIFEFAALHNATSFNFGESQMRSLFIRYQHFFKFPMKSAEASLHGIAILEKFKSGLIQTFGDVVQFGLKDEQFAILTHLLDICNMLQASSADCKRGFSLKNSIKIKTSSRLETDHLNMLMIIKCF